MKKTLVLFDIDYTLFDAKKYRDAFTNELFLQSKLQDKEAFLAAADNAYMQSKDEAGYFHPKLFLKKLSGLLNITFDQSVISKIIFKESLLKESLYKEVTNVISAFKKNTDFTLGIFSAGIISVQIPKIAAVQKYLDEKHIHIFEFKKKKALPDLLQSYKDYKVYIIDDVLEILYNAKQLHSDITTIWIKRGIYKNNQKSFPGFNPDYTVSNLEEILGIISK